MKRPLLLPITLVGLLSICSIAAADPPARVGRISATQGAVTFRQTISGEVQQATLNWPVTSDNELITDSAARVEFHVGSAAIRLDGNTDLTILQLDDTHFRFRLQRGTVAIQIRNAELAHDFELDTPQGHILLSQPSSLRIDARYDTPLTALSVSAGSASFDGGNARFSIPAGRRAEIVDGDLRVLESRRAYRDDDFDNWSAQRSRQDDRFASNRHLSPEITGYEELERNGEWHTSSVYGQVWSPNSVPAGWAPYQDGRWSWIAPWGWTWIDNASWGYAPSHYGRWVVYQQRWCWTPGLIETRPVWAPALVGWVGGPSWQVGFQSGYAPAVGWFPLAPREIYIPSYAVSPQYVQQINNTYLINGNVQVQNNTYYDGRNQVYQNQYARNAVTLLPRDQFSVSKTVIVPSQRLLGDRTQQLRSAQASATMPVQTAPSAVTNPVLPSYQRNPRQPAMGPVMQVERAAVPQRAIRAEAGVRQAEPLQSRVTVIPAAPAPAAVLRPHQLSNPPPVQTVLPARVDLPRPTRAVEQSVLVPARVAPAQRAGLVERDGPRDLMNRQSGGVNLR